MQKTGHILAEQTHLARARDRRRHLEMQTRKLAGSTAIGVVLAVSDHLHTRQRQQTVILVVVHHVNHWIDLTLFDLQRNSVVSLPRDRILGMIEIEGDPFE